MVFEKKGKIKYNSSFLREFIARVTSTGRHTRTSIVAAMNKDGSLPGDEKDKQVTLTQLSRWEKSGRAPQLERIISLINNFEDVNLEDFFLVDDNPIEYMVKQSTESVVAVPSDDTDMLRIELKYLKEIDTIRSQGQLRENDIKSNYEEKISAATQTIVEQEHIIRDANKMIHDQQLLVSDLQSTITKLQATISDQNDVISQQNRIIASGHYSMSVEKGATMVAED